MISVKKLRQHRIGARVSDYGTATGVDDLDNRIVHPAHSLPFAGLRGVARHSQQHDEQAVRPFRNIHDKGLPDSGRGTEPRPKPRNFAPECSARAPILAPPFDLILIPVRRPDRSVLAGRKQTRERRTHIRAKDGIVRSNDRATCPAASRT
jgi:hypothetical protein